MRRTLSRQLKKINPEFYPVPIRRFHDPVTNTITHLEIESGYLTKDDLIEVYGACSAVLHAENPYGNYEYTERNLPYKQWLEKTMILLGYHRVQLLHRDFQLVVIMHESSTKNVYFAVLKSSNLIEKVE